MPFLVVNDEYFSQPFRVFALAQPTDGCKNDSGIQQYQNEMKNTDIRLL